MYLVQLSHYDNCHKIRVTLDIYEFFRLLGNIDCTQGFQEGES